MFLSSFRNSRDIHASASAPSPIPSAFASPSSSLKLSSSARLLAEDKFAFSEDAEEEMPPHNLKSAGSAWKLGQPDTANSAYNVAPSSDDRFDFNMGDDDIRLIRDLDDESDEEGPICRPPAQILEKMIDTSSPIKEAPLPQPKAKSRRRRDPVLPPKKAERPAKADITVVPQRGSQSIPGQTGLRNLGNTCFMNAVLQALSNTMAFREYFVRKFLPKDKKGKLWRRETLDCLQQIGTHGPPAVQDTSMSAELHNIFRVVWSGKWAVITPFALLDALWKFVPHFRNYQQQDAQEFLVFLLDRLHNELKESSANTSTTVNTSPNNGLTNSNNNISNSSNGQTNSPLTPSRTRRPREGPSIISQTFQGQLRSQVTCSACNKISNCVEPFFDLSLDIPIQQPAKRGRKQPPPTCTLAECLDSYTTVETLDGKAYHCEFCGTKQDATKTLTIQTLPNVLCLVLKRFCWTKLARAKVDTEVQFPVTNLDMAPYSVEQTDTLYDLNSVVIHHGTGLRVGHYTAFCYNSDRSSWLHFNDSRVSVVSDEEVAESQAYILFYQRKSQFHGSATDSVALAGEGSPFKMPPNFRGAKDASEKKSLDLEDEDDGNNKEDSPTEEETEQPLTAAKRLAQRKKLVQINTRKRKQSDESASESEASSSKSEETEDDSSPRSRTSTSSNSSASSSPERSPSPPPKRPRGRPPTTKEGKLKRQRRIEEAERKRSAADERGRKKRKEPDTPTSSSASSSSNEEEEEDDEELVHQHKKKKQKVAPARKPRARTAKTQNAKRPVARTAGRASDKRRRKDSD